MAQYLIDSDVCILALEPGRNVLLKSELATRLTEGAAISVITHGEVMEGLLYGRQRARAMQRWREFLEPLDVVNVTSEIAEIWAELRGDLRRRGRGIADNDLMIAATALRFDLALLSRNRRHFERIQGLNLIVPEIEESVPAG